MNMIHNTMREIPASERPYEKCQALGPGRLTDAELLAVIIRTGTNGLRAVEVAMKVLNSHRQHKGLIGLHYVTLQDLIKIPGIGKVKAMQILAIAELSKRLVKQSRQITAEFDNPRDIAATFMEEMRFLKTECVVALLLDAKGQEIHHRIITEGSVNRSLSPTREILRYALEYDAVQFVLLHNHPSGDPTPSREDMIMTRKLVQGAELIGIPLMDHIVIGDNVYVSFQERGLMN